MVSEHLGRRIYRGPARIDWLRLIRSDNVGPRTFRSLINHFGSARRRAGAIARSGAPRRRGTQRRICSEDDARDRNCGKRPNRRQPARAGGSRLSAAAGARLTTRRRCSASGGALDVLMRPIIAIVGSRNASGAGLKFAGTIARDLGEAGFVIASGLARGIDQAAHRASLASGTVAVLAGGHDRIYPPEHEELLAGMLDAGGAAISEMPRRPRAARPRFSPAQPADLRRSTRRRRGRGRASLGLADHRAHRRRTGPRGVRGAGLAARSARRRNQRPDQAGRDTDHGGIRRHQCRRTDHGPAARVREEPERRAAGSPKPMRAIAAAVVSLLGPSPVLLDDLIRMAGTSPAIVRTVLLELELAGRLERQGGGLMSHDLNWGERAARSRKDRCRKTASLEDEPQQQFFDSHAQSNTTLGYFKFR